VIAPPGRESEALAVIRDMVKLRSKLIMSQDSFGNVIVRHDKEHRGAPLFFSAHIDHPALVVTSIREESLLIEYRGGSKDVCYEGAEALIVTRSGDVSLRILHHEESDSASPLFTCEMHNDVQVGDVGTLSATRESFACDDMAGVSALLHAMDRIDERSIPGPIRLIFTRAEEIGMIGAIGACRAGVIPLGSRVIAIDARNDVQSQRLIVSNRDRTGPVSPRLVADCVRCGCEEDENYVSATEAGAYGAFGFESVAVTFPIGYMHNNDKGRSVPEQMDAVVYSQLVERIAALMMGVSREPTRETLTRHFDRNMPLIQD